MIITITQENVNDVIGITAMLFFLYVGTSTFLKLIKRSKEDE